MMLSAEPISAFVHRHPTVKMLALSFLLLIGLSLVAEGFDHHIPKGYIYFAMGFSVFVEAINLRIRPKATPVHLHEAYVSVPDVKNYSGQGQLQRSIEMTRMATLICGGARSLRATRPHRRLRRALSRRPGRSAQAPLGPNQWLIDAGHSAANFSVRHLMVATVRGQLGPITGTVEYHGKDVRSVKADVTIDVKAINTQNTQRDQHLRSPDFFDTAKYPTITFKSKRVDPGAEGAAFKLIGDLTIRGTTREVTLDVEAPAPVTKGHARHRHGHHRHNKDQATRVWAEVQLDGRSRSGRWRRGDHHHRYRDRAAVTARHRSVTLHRPA